MNIIFFLSVINNNVELLLYTVGVNSYDFSQLHVTDNKLLSDASRVTYIARYLKYDLHYLCVLFCLLTYWKTLQIIVVNSTLVLITGNYNIGHE